MGENAVIGATGLTIIDKTWPRQVTALNVTCRTTDANFGDTVSMYALFSDQGYGEGVIGALQQDAPTGATGITVSSLLANSLYPGEYLYLASNSLGEIMSIDPSTNTIYCQIPTQTLYPAGTPISWRRYFIGPDFVLRQPILIYSDKAKLEELVFDLVSLSELNTQELVWLKHCIISFSIYIKFFCKKNYLKLSNNFLNVALSEL